MDNQIQLYRQRWRVAAPHLAVIARREARLVSTPQAILNLDDAFKMACQTMPPKATSGLVAWQKIMSRIPR